MIKESGMFLRTIDKVRIAEPFSQVAEIRLRAGRPAVCVDIRGGMSVCSEAFSAKEIADCFAEICRYSLHSFQDEIAEGFVTLEGGHRVGICGTVVKNNGRIEFIKDISGLDIRMAHQIEGCADEVYNCFFENGGCSLLLAGKPMSGKTTVLRELARKLGACHRVCVIDSRNEISASYQGTPAMDIGLNTDALCMCGKSEGILLALRSLSPEYIICDEIGGDAEAVERAMYCGVRIIASAHAGSLAELSARRETRNLLSMFDAAAVIGERGRLMEYREQRRAGG